MERFKETRPAGGIKIFTIIIFAGFTLSPLVVLITKLKKPAEGPFSCKISDFLSKNILVQYRKNINPLGP
jgi:hypothetical protein